MSAGEVKLLTEAEWAERLTRPYVDLTATLAELRERGLIAPEPVDLLLAEAREIAARYYDGREDGLARNMRQGRCDDQPSVVSALAAIRRGMELRPPLTLAEEQVRRILHDHIDRIHIPTLAPHFITKALHAALTDGGRDG